MEDLSELCNARLEILLQRDHLKPSEPYSLSQSDVIDIVQLAFENNLDATLSSALRFVKE